LIIMTDVINLKRNPTDYSFKNTRERGEGNGFSSGHEPRKLVRLVKSHLAWGRRERMKREL